MNEVLQRYELERLITRLPEHTNEQKMLMSVNVQLPVVLNILGAFGCVVHTGSFATENSVSVSDIDLVLILEYMNLDIHDQITNAFLAKGVMSGRDVISRSKQDSFQRRGDYTFQFKNILTYRIRGVKLEVTVVRQEGSDVVYPPVCEEGIEFNSYCQFLPVQQQHQMMLAIAVMRHYFPEMPSFFWKIGSMFVCKHVPPRQSNSFDLMFCVSEMANFLMNISKKDTRLDFQDVFELRVDQFSFNALDFINNKMQNVCEQYSDIVLVKMEEESIIKFDGSHYSVPKEHGFISKATKTAMLRILQSIDAGIATDINTLKAKNGEQMPVGTQNFHHCTVNINHFYSSPAPQPPPASPSVFARQAEQPSSAALAPQRTRKLLFTVDQLSSANGNPPSN